MQAVGDRGKSDQENAVDYMVGVRVLANAMREQGIRSGQQIGDFGCGIGYHLEWLHENGSKHLVGCDIAETHFDQIRKRVPNVCLLRADLTTDLPPLPALRVVICLDVTQHIMTEGRLRHLLKNNVARCLVPSGLFICTTLDDNVQRSYYERGWPVSTYARELPKGSKLAVEPRAYRDKVLFGFRMP